jgi:hypothetical protein
VVVAVLVTVDVGPGTVVVGPDTVVVAVLVTVDAGPATVLVTTVGVLLPFKRDSAPATTMAATIAPAPTPTIKFLRDTLVALTDASLPSDAILFFP